MFSLSLLEVRCNFVTWLHMCVFVYTQVFTPDLALIAAAPWPSRHLAQISTDLSGIAGRAVVKKEKELKASLTAVSPSAGQSLTLESAHGLNVARMNIL